MIGNPTRPSTTPARVLYEHTGIITEAWTNQAGQVH